MPLFRTRPFKVCPLEKCVDPNLRILVRFVVIEKKAFTRRRSSSIWALFGRLSTEDPGLTWCFWLPAITPQRCLAAGAVLAGYRGRRHAPLATPQMHLSTWSKIDFEIREGSAYVTRLKVLWRKWKEKIIKWQPFIAFWTLIYAKEVHTTRIKIPLYNMWSKCIRSA